MRVTLEYSNALLVAVMPYVSDCCQKLNVPIPTPLTTQQVRTFRCPVNEENPDNCVVALTNSCKFTFHHGMVDTFTDLRHSFIGLEDNRLRAHFYGRANMSEDEAIALAQNSLKRLGFSLEDIFVDCNPSFVKPPPLDGTNIIPYYEIEWAYPGESPYPGGRNSSVTVEVDAQSRKVTEWEVRCSTAWKDFLISEEEAMRLSGKTAEAMNKKKVNTDINTNILLNILDHYPECEKMLRIPVALPLTAGEVATIGKKGAVFDISVNGGYEFGIIDGFMRGYIAPDSFYRRTLRSPVRRYWGEWNMSEKEAVEMARQFLDKLHYWSHPCIYDNTPTVRKPAKAGSHTIARYEIEWEKDLAPREGPLGKYIPINEWAGVEIDATKKGVKSFSVYCPSLMSHLTNFGNRGTQP
jgi:hypothetical protein